VETNAHSHRFNWTTGQRAGVFVLSATSIACLLSEFYGLCPMRSFTLLIFGPAMLVLAGWVLVDSHRQKRLLWPILIGATSGFLAAISYDIFRLPFVYSSQWGLGGVVPQLNLFRAFPAFGAMLLGNSYPRASYSASESLLGWIYHFSNGITFGIMYVAAVGNPRLRHWAWAVVMAVGLEAAMLGTPYTQALGIPLTLTFVYVTLAAHMLFGVALGRFSTRFARLPVTNA
jgi:hypothetical protein